MAGTGGVVQGRRVVWPAIGAMLPMAVAIALNPLAIVAAVVLVLGDGGRLKAASFAAGSLVTITTATTLAFLLVEAGADADPSETADGVDIVQLVIGVGFWALAVVSWRSKRGEGSAGPAAGLVDRVARISPAGAFGLGLVQAVVVVKTIALAVGAGAQLGVSDVHGGGAVVAVAVFAFVATASLWAPVVGIVVGGDRVRAPMADVQRWLEENMATITVVVLVVLGAVLIGRGLAVLG
jgi:hypothetical protein